MFITYSLLIASLKKATLQTVDDQNVDTSNGTADLPDPKQQGVLPGTRLFHVVEWLAGADKKGNCLIILDECHKAKNLIAREGMITLCGCLQVLVVRVLRLHNHLFPLHLVAGHQGELRVT